MLPFDNTRVRHQSARQPNSARNPVTAGATATPAGMHWLWHCNCGVR